MTTNDQMQIRIHKAPLNTELYEFGAMPLIDPADRVEVELPDGTLLYGVVMSEWAEIRSDDSRVLTQTVRVYGIEPGGGA